MPRSPVAYLTNAINASVTTIRVDDISKLPGPPNIATIGDGVDSETIKYGGKSGDDLIGIVRGFEGDAKEWNAGAQIANVPCAQHIKALQASIVPSGCILMWGGAKSDIPNGWVLCDGANGTPDLRDRFILSVGTGEEPGGSGGSHTKVLAVANLPAHGHSYATSVENRSHVHTASVTIASAGAHHSTGRSKAFSGITASSAGWHLLRRVVSGDDYDATSRITHTAEGAHIHSATGTLGNASQTHYHSGVTDNTGLGAAIDIKPKYYKLAFIMKL